MFFYLSKIAWFLLQPSNLLLTMAAAGALALLAGRLRRLGRWLLGLGLTGLIICAFSPLGQWLILPLEERFPAWQANSIPPDGIILLGGSFETVTSSARGSVALNETAERVVEFAALSRRYPRARLVFTGGSGRLLFDEGTEADLAGRLLAGLGVDPDRIELEGRSRNTHENAVYTRELVQPGDGETWLLVTSAWHMPRAIGSFRAAGFPVEAYPVDFRTRGWQDVWRPFDSASEGLRRIDVAMREWVGLVAYYLTGKSSEPLPGPDR
jgi:uncharacterized SAM-binding protein YcdF (DUF218 family)